MGHLTIHNIDDDLLESFAGLPEAGRHLIEADMKDLLKTKLARRSRADIARDIAAMTPAGVVQTDSTLMIRKDRDEDH